MANMLNLSKEESINLLNLRKESINMLCLEKPILMDKPSRVAVVMDYSGSMGSLYRSGIVQAVLERLLPIAMQFDDNGEMELWIFSNGFYRLENITLKNFYEYVKREIESKGYYMGGTEYAPVMNDVVHKYIKEDPANLPNYIMFITDGDNSDASETTRVITEASKYPIFWQFVGIGNANFRFLKKLDDMEGRYVDNANFFELNDVMSISDRELYKRLMGEYPSWLAMPKVQEIIDNPTKFGSTQLGIGKKSFWSKLFG